ncbi:MAG: recombinase family protein [Candidatus Saccharimonadales bacterium]
MTNTKTVTLARVSSKAQEEEGYSLDAQLKLMRNYCKENKLQVVEEFKISETASKNERRKMFQQLLTYINKNKVSNLVVEKTDRLTRNLRDAAVVDDWLEANEDRRLHMVKESLVIHKRVRSDTRMIWNIYVAISRQHVDNLREEAMKGWAEKLAQGWMPAPPPPGYKTVTENGKKIHVVDESTSVLACRAFRLYTEPGQTIVTVTDEMAQCGLATRTGRPLCKTAIHRLLTNPFYIGTIRFNGQDYQGAYEPLIDEELFRAVQEKLDGRHVSRIKRHDPLFRGLLHCVNCGATITWQLQKGRYYGSCQRRNETCKHHPMIREDNLEIIVNAALQEIDEGDPERKAFHKIKEVLEESQQPYVGQHRLNVMKLIKRQIRRNEAMEDNLYEDKLSGVIGEDKYQTKSREITANIDQLQDRLHRIEAIEGATKTDASTADTLVDLYESESKTGKRIILAKLITIYADKGCVIITPVGRKKSKLPPSGMIKS